MKIYAGMLLEDITEKDLQDLFEKYGNIKSVEIHKENLKSGYFRYGIIEIPNKIEAWEAIHNLDGYELKGILLSVHPARTGLEDRRKSDRGGGRRRTDSPPPKE
ncbi:MAG: RNA-binding protein [Calditrichota bacterium]|jgi:RNA recognition motif-containing protein